MVDGEFMSDDVILCKAGVFEGSYPTDERLREIFEETPEEDWDNHWEFCHDDATDLIRLVELNGERLAITGGQYEIDGYLKSFNVYRLDKRLEVRKSIPHKLKFKSLDEE